jgi:hypothetical protein
VAIIQFSGLFPASIATRLQVNHASSILAILGMGVISAMFRMRHSLAIGSGLALAALIVMVFLPRDPQIGFGDIKRSRMTEFHPSSRYLRIGSKQMEWSLMSTRGKTGWLYFTKPGDNDPLWEFAPCSRPDFSNLRPIDFDAEFVHIGDTNRIKSAFDADSWLETTTRQNLSGNAIPVREGQIILARLIDAPLTVYAIRLVDQRGAENWGGIEAEYVQIELQKAEPSQWSEQP